MTLERLACIALVLVAFTADTATAASKAKKKARRPPAIKNVDAKKTDAPSVPATPDASDAASPAPTPPSPATPPPATLSATPIAPTPAADSTPVPPLAGQDAKTLLAKARELYEALEYDRIVPLADAILAIPDLDLDTKLDAYLLQAEAIAIVGDPIEAEKPFRMLFRARPTFDLPAGTPPKIMMIFRKVQAEERAILDQLQALQRKKVMEGLKLVGEPPQKAKGGEAISFAFRLRDPTSSVQTISVPYRRKGDDGYSVLALQRDDEGTWRGIIPGEWTASENEYQVEFYVETRDGQGPLLSEGSDQAPLAVVVAAGSFERQIAKPIPRWALWSGVAATAVAAATASGFSFAELSAQKDYDRYKTRSGVINGATLNAKADRGQMYARAATVSWIVAGVVAAATAGMWPFTKPAE